MNAALQEILVGYIVLFICLCPSNRFSISNFVTKSSFCSKENSLDVSIYIRSTTPFLTGAYLQPRQVIIRIHERPIHSPTHTSASPTLIYIPRSATMLTLTFSRSHAWYGSRRAGRVVRYSTTPVSSGVVRVAICRLRAAAQITMEKAERRSVEEPGCECLDRGVEGHYGRVPSSRL